VTRRATSYLREQTTADSSTAPRISSFCCRLLHRRSPKSLFADTNQGRTARRNQLIRRAHLQCGCTLGEIAAYLDIHYTIVSKVVNEIRKN